MRSTSSACGLALAPRHVLPVERRRLIAERTKAPDEGALLDRSSQSGSTRSNVSPLKWNRKSWISRFSPFSLTIASG
jgi:hypothetical protein